MALNLIDSTDIEVNQTGTNIKLEFEDTNFNNKVDTRVLLKNTYSTTETRIGTWIDGKPLYRKVIAGTFAYATQTITDIITGYDKVINYGGTITTPSGYITQIPEYTNSNNFCYFVLNTANDDATLTIPSSFVGGTFILIVEYTKTTD